MSRLRDIPHKLAGRVLPWFVARYIRLVKRVVRWRWEGREILDRVAASETPVIVAFWHGRILMATPLIEASRLPVKVMISNNRDGEMIARAISHFGAQSIRGSTRDPRKSKHKGGGQAMREAVEHIAGGGVVALTPDGPRGPRMRAQRGVAAIAIATGTPVMPVAFSTRPGRRLGSWDRFHLALPWGRGSYVIGEPLVPPDTEDDASQEAYRQRIEDAITSVTRRADAMLDRETPEPEPPRGSTA